MSANPVTNLSFPTPLANGARGARKDEVDRDGQVTTGMDAIPVAFDALLKTIQAVVPRGSQGESGGKTVASQMFEPAGANPHERRRAIMQTDYQSPARDAKYAPANPTDVESRLASRADRNAESFDRPIEGRLSDSNASTSLARVTSRNGLDSMTYGDPIQTSRGPGSDALLKTGGTDQRSMNQMSVAAAAPPTGVVSVSTDTTAATGAVRAVQVAAGAKASSSAQQLATLLGGARGGEVETGRAATAASSTPNDARSSGGQQSLSQRSAADAKPGGELVGARSSPGGDRAGEVGRSKFDELVHSIRLQTTSRRSSARLQLHPPELGRIYVNLRVEGDRVRIDVRTETGAARTLLAERGNELRVALEQHGITVEKFEVVLEPTLQNPVSATDEADSALNDSMAGRGDSDDQGSTRTSNEEVSNDEGGDGPDLNEIETTTTAAGNVDGRSGIDIRI